jgi:hypothetical protein
MSAVEADHVMPRLETRDEYIEHLEAEAAGAEPTGARLRKNLVKSYVIETVRDFADAPNPADLCAEAAGLRADPISGGDLYRLHDPKSGNVVAILEGADTRFPVVHSTLKTQPIDQMVTRAVQSSLWLDHVWLPGRFFDALWDWTKRTADPSRLARLKFSYTAHYEQPNDGVDAEVDDDEDGHDTDDEGIREIRHSQFEVADRVGLLDQKLAKLTALYAPLQSTVRIKIPSGGLGGHEVYDNGKVTNRSVSFAEQQKIVRLIIDLYSRVTEDAEDKLWYGTERDVSDGAGFTGRPVLLEFEQPLELATLHKWADRTFGSSRNRFRLGGQPMWSGADRTRLHVYGIDRHLLQPITLEATRNHILAILPVGTCGNTINRLLTNVQQYLAPGVNTWVGEFPYAELLTTPTAEAR